MVDVASRIEPYLDHSEVCSLIFLLYDNEDIALQDIQQEIQSTRKYSHVLDSTLWKQAEVYNEGVLARWARANMDKDWKDKLLESLLIIKNHQIIRILGESKDDLEDKYLPHQKNTSYRVDLVRKALYLMIEDLTNQQWNQLRAELTKDETSGLGSINSMFLDVREYVLTHLMSRHILITKTEKRKMDFVKIRSALKNTNLYYWSDHLKYIEDHINGEQNVVKEDHGAFSTTPLPSRFNLDPHNQGTMLIFNMENYRNTQYSKRIGSGLDRDRLKNTFELFKFKVKVFDNLPSVKVCSEIRTHLRKFCLDAKQNKVERCFIVALLGHGEEDGFIGDDGDRIEWRAIHQELRSADTLGLPRMLIVQACKGNSQISKKLDVVEDGPSNNSSIQTGNLKDLYEFSASVAGFAAYRSVTLGSFFIRSTCKFLLQYGNKCAEIQDLAAFVNLDFNNYQLSWNNKTPVELTSEVKATPTKKLSLKLPKENEEAAVKLLAALKEMHVKECSSSEEKTMPMPRRSDACPRQVQQASMDEFMDELVRQSAEKLEKERANK